MSFHKTQFDFKIATLTFKALETGLPPYLSQQLHPYAPTIELYALPHPNFFKFRALTSTLVRVLSVYQLLPLGTHCLTAFASLNL